jgi:hypothetical protein
VLDTFDSSLGLMTRPIAFEPNWEDFETGRDAFDGNLKVLETRWHASRPCLQWLAFGNECGFSSLEDLSRKVAIKVSICNGM